MNICAFCDKPQEQVKKLVAGSANIFICDVCAEICAELCREGNNTIELPTVELSTPTPREIQKSLDEL